MDNDDVYSKFIDHIMSTSMLWSCFATVRSSNYSWVYSAINSEKALIVILKLIVPCQVIGKKSDIMKWRTQFDRNKHKHFYAFEVQDLAYRWGRKRILDISAEPGDYFYKKFCDYQGILDVKANMVSKERPFDSRVSGIREALESMQG